MVVKLFSWRNTGQPDHIRELHTASVFGTWQEALIPSTPTSTPVAVLEPPKVKLETVTLDKNEAERLYHEYKEQTEKNNTKKLTGSALSLAVLDQKIVALYDALRQEQTVINLEETFQNIGVFENGLPKLAVTQAHVRKISTKRERFDMDAKFLSWDPKGIDTFVRSAYSGIPFPNSSSIYVRESISGTASVPVIPPGLRPDNLENFYILWEATWENIREEKRRLVDPFLLRHIGGSLYALVAQWDVSPIEAEVLKGL